MGSSRGGGRHNQLAVAYVVVCLVLSVLAFVAQIELCYLVLLVAMLPISLAALAVTYIGGVIIFGPGDWPTWALLAVALIWTGFAVVQASAVLALCRARSKRASA